MLHTYEPTRYEEDFIFYYEKAKYLQFKSLHPELNMGPVGDPLMDQVHIYDTVERRYAGFSKVYRDLHGDLGHKPHVDKFKELDKVCQTYLYLVHRITGSGASFEHDHGYRNTILLELVNNCSHRHEMAGYLYEEVDQHPKPRPIFTSVGNTIPPFPKPQTPYNRGSFLYLCAFAPYLAEHFYDYAQRVLKERGTRLGIREGVDWCLQWHKRNGLKLFKFVLTAWVMDFGDHFPDLIDPWSVCNYGKNALISMNLLYNSKTGVRLSPKQVDDAVHRLSGRLEAKPMDLEDVLCDYVRYVENYVPLNRDKDYEHLNLKEVFNRSLIKDHSEGRQEWKLGTDLWVW